MDTSAPPLSGPVSDRVRLLLGSLHSLGGVDDLGSLLQHTVDLGRQLTGAAYGALGVVGDRDPIRFTHFITSGMSEADKAALGEPPHGLGLLGRLIREPHGLRVEDLTQEPDAVGFPPGHPPMRTFLGMPLRIGSRIYGNIYLTDKAGGQPFTPQDELAVEALAAVAGAVIDAVRRRLRSEAQAATVDTVAQINHALLTEEDPASVVPLIVRQAAQITGARMVAVVAPTAAGAAPAHLIAASGQDTQTVLHELAARISQVLATGVPEHEDGSSGATLLDHSRGDARTSIVPVQLRHGEQVALVVAGWRPPVAVPAGLTHTLVESLADQVGLVLDRAAAVRDHDALTTLADRERIARDLHDLVIQRIFATGLTLQGATRLTRDPEVLRRIDATIEELDATMRDIRATIFALQPPVDGASLRAQIRELVSRYAQSLGFVPTLRFGGAVDSTVDPESRAAVLMVLREALSNVVRHSGAQSVHIDVTAAGHHLVLVVTDDGVGLSPRVVESGLRNVRRRADERGGSMQLEAHAPKGTVLRWTVPLAS